MREALRVEAQPFQESERLRNRPELTETARLPRMAFLAIAVPRGAAV